MKEGRKEGKREGKKGERKEGKEGKKGERKERKEKGRKDRVQKVTLKTETVNRKEPSFTHEHHRMTATTTQNKKAQHLYWEQQQI